MRRLPESLHQLAELQAGLVTISQLHDHRMDGRTAQRRVDLGIWQAVSPRVFAVHPHAISRHARLWAASLHFDKLGLTGSAALELVGLPTPHEPRIDLIGPRGGRPMPFSGCVVHTARDGIEFEESAPRRTKWPLAVVHACGWAVSRRQAIFYVTWAVQHRLVTLQDLNAELSTKPTSIIHRHAAKHIRLVDEGVHSINEFDFLQECRKRLLPEPIRQRQRRDSRGRNRYTDFEFTANGRTIVVEIDGLGHLDTEVHLDDQWRANELVLQGSVVLRVPGLALRLDPDPFFEQLAQALNQLRNAA